jgi:hypothetical protein
MDFNVAEYGLTSKPFQTTPQHEKKPENLYSFLSEHAWSADLYLCTGAGALRRIETSDLLGFQLLSLLLGYLWHSCERASILEFSFGLKFFSKSLLVNL